MNRSRSPWIIARVAGKTDIRTSSATHKLRFGVYAFLSW